MRPRKNKYIITTGLTHESQALEVMSREFGAAGFLLKPLQIQDVIRIVNEKLEQSQS